MNGSGSWHISSVVRLACDLLPPKVAIEELNNHVQCIFRLRHIRVVEEPVEEPFPYMEFRINAQSYELLVRVQGGTQLKAASARDDERRWKFRKNLRRADG